MATGYRIGSRISGRISSRVTGKRNGTVTLDPGFNNNFVVDDLNNYIVDDSENYIVAYNIASITIAVQDGASSPRNLVAADISTIGYYQIYGGIRATPGPVYFTPVDVAEIAVWQSGGIYSSGGNLRIYLPIAALIGDPDEIEIQIIPASGTVVLPDPTQPV